MPITMVSGKCLALITIRVSGTRAPNQERLLAALKRRRHGQRDWLIGLLIYRHGLRVSEACDLRWDDVDLTKRTITLRRLKGSNHSRHYLERDELAGLKALHRGYAAKGLRTSAVSRLAVWASLAWSSGVARSPTYRFRFTFTCCGIRPGMLWRRKEWIHVGCNTFLVMRASPTRYATPPCRRNRSRTCGARPRRIRP